MNYFIISNKQLNIMEAKKKQKSFVDTGPAFSGSKEITLQSSPYVQKMLQDIPKDLQSIFAPVTENGLVALEASLIKFGKAQKEREQVTALQKSFNLPFRPNMSLRETIIRVKIECLRRYRREKYGNPFYNDSDVHNL